ncbi:MAG: Si-specific NAD(P)(+) transhydrogenase [Acidobacteriia bacterium]|nr:Si-specific NAD(P)(+) transhydrogenase [Terriglobia bacterium]
MEHYDVLILGGGPAGERAAIGAARIGKKVALIERENVVGGTCINWGTIPSKTLRESALFVLSLTRNKVEGIRTEIADRITVQDFMFRERRVVQRELELVNRTLDRYKVEVFEGHGRLVDEHTVSVSGPDGKENRRFSGDVIVIATGSLPSRPEIVPFDHETVFDSNTILQLPRMPATMLVLGAGVIGVEYASIFAALGVRIVLVDTRDQLLPYLDREIAGILERELVKLGVEILRGDACERIERVGSEPPRVRCRTRSGRVLEVDAMLYAVGRDGNTRDLGLEGVGIRPNARGLLEVNEWYQTVHPHIFAVGDVIGYPALASTSMEQGRQAIRHAYDVRGPRGRTTILPFALYSIPEVSYIGETEAGLLEKSVDFVVGRGRYEYNPRGQIMGDTEGLLKLLFETDSGRLVGAHMIGHGASELVHIGQAFLNADADATTIAETLFNYPTLSDLYRHAALEALAERRRRLAR